MDEQKVERENDKVDSPLQTGLSDLDRILKLGRKNYRIRPVIVSNRFCVKCSAVNRTMVCVGRAYFCESCFEEEFMDYDQWTTKEQRDKVKIWTTLQLALEKAEIEREEKLAQQKDGV